MMNFLNNIKDSLYNPDFYSGLKERRLSFSFKYFFSLAATLSIILAFMFGLEFAPIFSAENLRKLAGFYPEELVLQVAKGVISTNVVEPYIIKDTFEISNDSEKKYANAVVIDTKNDFSAK